MLRKVAGDVVGSKEGVEDTESEAGEVLSARGVVDSDGGEEEGCDHDGRDKDEADLVGCAVTGVEKDETRTSTADVAYAHAEAIEELGAGEPHALQHGLHRVVRQQMCPASTSNICQPYTSTSYRAPKVMNLE